MTLCKLNFEITVNVQDEPVDELGNELATFLQESWFNGEDVLEVKYKNHKPIQ